MIARLHYPDGDTKDADMPIPARIGEQIEPEPEIRKVTT